MKISICGDVCPGFSNDIWVSGDTDTLFHDVPTAFADSDRVIVNLECALTDSNTPIKKLGAPIKASPLCAEVLKRVGVTDCALSNNHVFDLGIQGIKDTIEAVENAGLNHTGFGENYEDARKNLVMEKDGLSVAFVNVCEHEYGYAMPDRMGARGFDVYDTMSDIRKAKETSDYVVVLYHGGKEQSIYPSPRLRKQSQEMIRQGADVVLCQHSHCIGCYEQYAGGHILYGQGNFHFINMYPNHPHWQSGLIVQMDVSDGLLLEFVPVEVVENGIQLAKGEKAAVILKMFESQSADLQSDEWLKGWRQFCEDGAQSYYIDAIKNAHTENATDLQNEIFAHYLYCEAHRDVLEELCKVSWETRLEP